MQNGKQGVFITDFTSSLTKVPGSRAKYCYIQMLSGYIHKTITTGLRDFLVDNTSRMVSYRRRGLGFDASLFRFH